jgi:hypothetical protein
VVPLKVNVLLGIDPERYRAIAELKLIRRDREHIRNQERSGFLLVTVNLVDAFDPIVAATDDALEFGDDQRNPVDQKHRVGLAGVGAPDSVLVGDGEVVEVLLGESELDESDRGRRLARLQDKGDPIAEGIEGAPVGVQGIGRGHDRPQDGDGRLGLRFRLDGRIDPHDGRNQQRLDQRIVQWPAELLHLLVRPVPPPKTAIMRFLCVARQPFQDRSLDVPHLGHHHGDEPSAVRRRFLS